MQAGRRAQAFVEALKRSGFRHCDDVEAAFPDAPEAQCCFSGRVDPYGVYSSYIDVNGPDGPGGIPGGTVRISDHAQPVDRRGRIVGGYDARSGARHDAATLSLDPSTGLRITDAVKALGGARCRVVAKRTPGWPL